MIIQDGMQILVRTEEEWQTLIEVANKEGIKWNGGQPVYKSDRGIGSIFVGSYTPRRLTRELNNFDYRTSSCPNVVEASDLFRNQIISKRIKEGKT